MRWAGQPAGIARRRTAYGGASICALACFALFAAIARPSEARVIVFGVDGAAWPRIDAGIAKGELPHFAALQARGVTAELETVEPVISPTVWTSIATGVSPEVHGVTDFFRNRTHVRVPTIFERLAASGKRVGLYDWLVTWPPRGLPNGYVIPDWLRRDDRVTPPDVFERAGLTPYAYSIVDVSGLEAFHDNALRETQEKPGRFLALLKAFDLDVATVTFYSVDATGHRFWRAAFPGEFDTPRTPEEERFADTIPDTYRRVDAALGAVVAALAPEDSIVVMSDHGFQASDDPRHVWSTHTAEMQKMLGLDLERDGVAIDGEFMALMLRVLPGKPEVREPVIARLLERFGSLKSPSGEPLLALDVLPEAERPPAARGTFLERVRAFGLRLALRFWFGLTLDRPAYAYVLARPNDLALSALWPNGEVEVMDQRAPIARLFRVDDFTGAHDPTAIFLAAGGPIAHRPTRDRLLVLDLAPLILYLADAPIPDDLEGELPERFLASESLAQRPARRVTAAELPGLPPEPADESVDDAVLVERLRALGYVD